MLNLKQKLKQNSTDSQIQIAALGVGLRAVFDKYSGMIALVRKWPETDLEELLYGKVEYPHAWKTKYQVINDINTAIERWEKGENVEEGIVFSLSKPNAI